MARPNNFIMNTDYISIAQSGSYSFNYIVNGGTIAAHGQIIQHSDFTVPAQKGSIDQIMISMNGSNLKVGNRFGFDFTEDCGGYLDIYRTAPNTVRAEITINNLLGESSYNYPLMNFTIKALCFKPPNIF